MQVELSSLWCEVAIGIIFGADIYLVTSCADLDIPVYHMPYDIPKNQGDFKRTILRVARYSKLFDIDVRMSPNLASSKLRKRTMNRLLHVLKLDGSKKTVVRT